MKESEPDTSPNLLQLISTRPELFIISGMDVNRRQFLKKFGSAWMGAAVIGYLPSILRVSQPLFVQDSSLQQKISRKGMATTMNPITFPDDLTQAEIDFIASHELIRGDAQRQVAMLTYDDARSVERISHLMDVYRENGAKFTLFVIGTDLDSCKEILPKFIDEGHELGCHGWSHDTLTSMSDQGLQDQFERFLQKTAEILPDYRVRFFRAPYGERNQRVRDIAARNGLQHVLWSLESGGQDTSTYHNVVDRLQPGEIILSHETRYFDVNDADVIVRELIRKGYNLETISSGMSPTDQWTAADPNIMITQESE